ncbi:cell division protein FtsQ [Pedobacter sp. CG_S7]|uniref:cell division protein FtsQ/DivIB n=1 Tax=Pedobacter sp. CG_S7 TaxID=3143930 RepID=UPI0033967860
MLKGINWKSILKVFAWVFSLAGVIVLMSFISVKRHTVNCSNIKIFIPGADNFIEREEVDVLLKQSQGSLIGRKLLNIDLNEIERKMMSNPYIALAKVYADMDGVIHIEIKQRQPILRVINAGGQDFYIDKEGLKMPVSANFTANVLVANGNIREHFSGRLDTLSTKKGQDLYRTALFINADTLWNAQIEQIFIDERQDMELVPRVGNQRIILGNADSLEIKMKNLMVFYKKAMPKVGWDTYKTINIKFTNQIVCERNFPDSTRLLFLREADKDHKLKIAKIALSLKNQSDKAAKEVKTEAGKKTSNKTH